MELENNTDKMCQDNKQIPVVEKITYNRREGTSALDGQLYEVRLEMIFLLQGIIKHKNKQIDNFLLATNMREAGNFDDIVFKYDYKNNSGELKSKIIFLQAKHKKDPIKSKISLNVLFPEQNNKTNKIDKAFNLNVYFKSYGEVKKQFSSNNLNHKIFKHEFINSEFVIYTNASADDNFRENKYLEISKVPDDDIFNFTGNTYYYKLKLGGDKSTDDNILKALLGSTKCNSIETAEVVDFLDKLKIYIGQPNKDVLVDILKRKIQSAFTVKITDIDLFFLDIQNKLQKRADEENKYLTENCELFEDTKQNLSKLTLNRLSKLLSEKVQKLQLSFNIDQIKNMQKLICENQACSIITNSNTTLLSTAMVHQALQVKSEFHSEYFDNYIFMSLSSIVGLQDEVINTFKSETTNLLVIECESMQIIEKIEELCQELSIIVRSNKNNKKILLIAQEGNILLENFKAVFSRVTRYKEVTEKINGLTDLTVESQEILLETGNVIFQGEEVSLETVFDEQSKCLIDAETLSKLINNEKIEIGKALNNLGDVEYFYINRIFRNYVKVKDDFFKTDNHRDIFVLSNISQNDCSNLFSENNVCKFEDRDYNKLDSIRFILLEDTYNSEENFNQLCKDYGQNNIHWLKKEDGSFIWQKTYGTLTNLRRFVDGRIANEYKEDEIISISDKFMILSAEAGMGKSTIITKLAKQLKILNNSLWVIRINLNDHSKILSEADFNEDKNLVIKFLLDISNVKTNLEMDLFKNRLKNNGKIVLFFDGFDEISPYYEEKVMKMLTLLKDTKIEKIWITTRLYKKNVLEDKFGTITHSLKALSFVDQKMFLRKFWGQNLNLILKDEDERVSTFIEKLLEVLKNSIADKEVTFTGIPLQTRMLAEIFQEDFEKYYSSNQTETNICNELNLIDLYEGFIIKKYEIYCIEKRNEEVTRTSVKVHNRHLFQIFKEQHELLALKMLFSNEELKPILSNEELQAIFSNEDFNASSSNVKGEQLINTKVEEENTGIINEIINGRPIFIHRTFAEFFAANWFTKNYKKQTVKDLLEVKLFEKENEVFRNLFDRLLTKDDCGVTNKYELHNAVLSKDESKIKELLSDPLKRNNINHTDKGGRTALHLAASYGYKNLVDVLLEHDANVLAPDDILNWIPLRYADKGNYWSIVEVLIKNKASYEDMIEAMKLSDKEKTYDDEYEYSLFHLAAKNGYISLLESLIERESMNANCINILDKCNNTPLHFAAQCGQTDVVKYLLSKGADLDAVNLDSKTPLSLAAVNGEVEIIKLLVENGVDLNKANKKGRTSFHLAVRHGNMDLVEYLMEKNGDFINIPDDNGQSSVHLAVKSGNLNNLKLLLEKGADFNKADKSNHTPFQIAIRFGKSEVVKYLMEKDSNLIYIPGSNGQTSVHTAARYGKIEILKFLVERGADLNKVDNNGRIPFHVAIRFGKTEVVKYLMEKNFNVIKIVNDFNRQTSVHIAAENGETEILKLLLKNDANYLNVTDINGNTPLHLAVRNGKTEIVKYLIEIDANLITIPDKNGKTPLYSAAKYNKTEILKLLIKTEEDLNKSRNDDRNPFHVAIQFGKIELVKYFIEEDAECIYVANLNGKTCVHFAARYGKVEILNLLIEKGADLNRADNFGYTPFQVAVRFGKFEIVQCLLERDINLINNPGSNGSTSVHTAAKYGRVEILKLLVAKGADLNKADKSNYTPFQTAVLSDKIGIVKCLLENDPNIIHNLGSNGQSFVHTAVKYNKMEILKLLVERGADINKFDKSGRTPFHIAVRINEIEIVKYLMEKDVNVINVTNYYNGQTSVHVAAEYGRLEILKLLIERGGDLNVDRKGHSPFHVAVRFRQIEIVNCLLEKNADYINIPNINGKTSVHLAAENGSLDILKLLIARGADLNLCDEKGKTPLQLAIANAETEVVNYINEVLPSG